MKMASIKTCIIVIWGIFVSGNILYLILSSDIQFIILVSYGE